LIYITGKNGQLASDLEDIFSKENIPFKSFSKAEWDISNQEDCERVLTEDCRILINTAAYTKVDLAESDEHNVNHVNGNGVRNLAIICQEKNIKLIQISTDFLFHGILFDEMGELRFWKPLSRPNPIGVYAKSKYKSELEVIHRMRPDQFHIIRTSWLYSHKGQNFVNTILKLLSQENRRELTVIEDQLGRPTYAYSLAKFIFILVSKINQKEAIPNVLHFSNIGIASWYDFAVEIQRISLEKGLLKKKIPIIPIPTERYPTPAKRPKFSILNLEKTLEIFPEIPHWREDLDLCISKVLD
jgi:dTDP-4-dehydrorhamnose reductase